MAFIHETGHEINRAQLAQKRCIEGDFVHAVQDFARRFRHARTLDRVDLDDEHVIARRVIKKRPERRVAHIPAIPIGNAINFDGLEHEWQTGRGQDVIDGQLRLVEHLGATCLDVRGRNKHLEHARAHAVKVDSLLQQIPQWIEIQGIEVIGAGDPRKHVEENVAG